ncbi:MAG: DUF2236 domain-containing protein [Gammaproteobacteria bacterium]|nr:DUF2236 domain-containing protein [Gammaproteobacteria bacterium]MBU0786438.1 DUF2236 domain-containing protein [Gammaproteobacteria bacterium]MBU0816141.1 DUF2236 domain-containing protein [Gammaproteobacteria bacterium]MBU1787833.1 DUF2236 domain-containing protein [Gammaproteobacteria bacterium]
MKTPDEPKALLPPNLLAAMQRQADPLADDTMARMLGPWPAEAAAGQDEHWQRLAAITQMLSRWTDNASLSAAPGPGVDPVLAQALNDYVQAGRQLPAWAEPAKLLRAEQIFMEHGALSCILLFCASLPECYVIPDLSSVLHASGQLEAHTEYRIRATAAMIFPVMMRGGLTREEGGGVAQVLKVRLIHATIRNLILRGSPQAALAGPGNVPALPLWEGTQNMHQTFYAGGWNLARDGLPCNQSQLAYTLLTFSYVFLRSLRRLGIGLRHDDEEAYLHAWNVVGHVLGIESSLMVHTMEDSALLLAQLQAGGRAQQLEPDPRPGLSEALMQTMEQVIPWGVVRPFPRLMTADLCGAHIMGDLGLKVQVPWLSRLLFVLLLGTARRVDRLVRPIWPNFSISRMLTRVLGYHFMARILMDQTRPLKLPEGLLEQAGQMMDSWSTDPHAPRWLASLESRLTTRVRWFSGTAKA